MGVHNIRMNLCSSWQLWGFADIEGEKSYSEMIPKCFITVNRKGKSLTWCLNCALWKECIIVLSLSPSPSRSLLLSLHPLSMLDTFI